MGPPLPGASISKPDMLDILSNRIYRHLFTAQVIALIGTGLATVALGLLAFDLAGDNAGMVLGTALAIKMVAYVGVAPVSAAFAERWPRRTMLVTLDLVRAGVALMLPFVSQIWQVYVLIFVLQAVSAARPCLLHSLRCRMPAGCCSIRWPAATSSASTRPQAQARRRKLIITPPSSCSRLWQWNT
jgi:MFS family permease